MAFLFTLQILLIYAFCIKISFSITNCFQNLTPEIDSWIIKIRTRGDH